MTGSGLTFKFGFAEYEFSVEQWQAIKRRFSRPSILGSPCLIIDRDTGLALDAGTDPGHRTRPVLWAVHAAPWQQWRIKKAGNGFFNIISEHGGLALTTDVPTENKAWMWLEALRGRDSQLWRITPTEDSVAYAIETKRSDHALDTGIGAINGTSPIMWATHWEAQQQWIICRLSLK